MPNFSFRQLLQPLYRFLWNLGYEYRPVSNPRWNVHHLRQLDFHPHTVVDVGVALDIGCNDDTKITFIDGVFRRIPSHPSTHLKE